MRFLVRAGLCVALLGTPCWTAPAGPLTSQDTAVIDSIVDSLYRMRFEQALATCRELAAKSPQDPLPDVFLARVIWQRELSRKQALALTRFAAQDFFLEASDRKHGVEPDPEVEREFRSTTARAVEKAKRQVRLDPGDLRAWFLMGLAYQNISAFAVAFRGGWREAFLSGESTRRAHRRVSARYPQFADSLLSLAVYEYVVANVNWLYRALGAVIGVRGSESRGIANMQKVAKEGVLFGPDARTMLVLVYTRKGMFQQAAETLAGLRSEYPENCLIPLDQGTLAMQMRRYGDAAAFYNDLNRQSQSPTYEEAVCPEQATVLYRLGIAENARGQRLAAVQAFQNALAARGQARTKILARLDLARTLDLLGRRGEAVQQYLIVRNSEDAGGSRALAATYLAKPYSQEP